MQESEVRTTGEALAYLTDCTLATVEYMACLKSKSKSEYQRQIRIAQLGCDWMEDLGVSPAGTRATDIIGKTTVEEWAMKQ